MDQRPKLVRSLLICGLFALAIFYFRDLLLCSTPCVVDLNRWSDYDPKMIELAKADLRLNTWIIAWVQHALTTQPTKLFDANAFHPAPRTLAGSEHMLAPAVLMLPLRLVTDDATTVYNVALVFSFVVAGISTYLFALFITKSQWPSFLAGATAMFMPWRLNGLAHIQLLFACWLPLVWLLIAATLFEEARARRYVALAAAWSALLFSSYYLAYISCFTTAIYSLVLVFSGRRSWRSFAGVLLSLAVPLVLLAAFSVPYMQARAHADLAPAENALLTLWPALLFSHLLPPHIIFPSLSLPWHAAYSVPWSLLILAACSAVTATWSALRGEPRAYVRPVLLGLAAASLFAVIMALGNEVQIGDIVVPLPSRWLRRVVPGFEMMRAPLRWTLVLGAALPVLAAAGYQHVTALASRIGSRFGTLTAAVLAILLVLPFVPPALPTAAAYPGNPDLARLYDALAKLPTGPVLEIPWPQHPLSNAVTSSEYMVASTRYWKPLLNGYSGYSPRSYGFLVRLGSRLPQPWAVDLLRKLTGLRWVVVHLDELPESARVIWSMAATRGALIPAYRSESAVIYEVADARPVSEELQHRLFSSDETRTTITGIARSPLRIASEDAQIVATFPTLIRRYEDGWANASVPARVVNESTSPWPGLDPQPSGLVNVRFTIRGSEGTLLDGISPLNADVPAHGELWTNVFVQGRLDEGEYTICFELVQAVGSQWQTIGLSPSCGPARVTGAGG